LKRIIAEQNLDPNRQKGASPPPVSEKIRASIEQIRRCLLDYRESL
jgi:hypothetical protein